MSEASAKRWIGRMPEAMSPVRYVGIDPALAVFLPHGMDDDAIPASQSQILHDALQQAQPAFGERRALGERCAFGERRALDTGVPLAEALAMPCNTAHHYAAQIAAMPSS